MVRICPVALALYAVIVTQVGAAEPADTFALLERVPYVVSATIAERRELAEPRLVVYRLAKESVLKGPVPAPLPAIVEELLFSADKAHLAENDVRILLLELFPAQSRLAGALTEMVYFRLAGPNVENAILPASLREPITAYLKALTESATIRTGRRLDVMTSALSMDLLGDDAVLALDRVPKLDKELTPKHVAAIEQALQSTAVPTARRRAILDLIGRQKLRSLDNGVHALLNHPELAPFARRAAAALGERVTIEAVRADLSSAAWEARLAAVQSAAGLPAQQRAEVLGMVARTDGAQEVRLEAIRMLGKSGSPAITELVTLLDDGDQQICYHATQSLADIGGIDAERALSRTFETGSYEAQVAAVFALRRLGTPSAMASLEEVRKHAPDHRLIKVIDTATGHLVHEHE